MRGVSFGIPTQAIYTVITGLAIVIGAFLIFAWALRRGGKNSNRRRGALPSEVVSVLGRAPLAARQFAELLRVGNKLVLVAMTPTGPTTITEVTDPVEVDRLVGMCQQFEPHSTTKAFEQVFQQFSSEPTSGGFLGGEPLPAVALVGRFGVSQSPRVVACVAFGAQSCVRCSAALAIVLMLTVTAHAQAEIPAASLLPGGIGGPAEWTSPQGLASTLQIMLLLTVVSLAPAILLMTTGFVRIIVVLGLLRQALGTQQLPPSQVITSIALFMTLLLMAPVWNESYEKGIKPYTNSEIGLEDAFTRAVQSGAAIHGAPDSAHRQR